jgi:hypothetical protein
MGWTQLCDDDLFEVSTSGGQEPLDVLVIVTDPTVVTEVICMSWGLDHVEHHRTRPVLLGG